MSQAYTLPFDQINASDLLRVGGKGANLGEMTQAGFPVPQGFCVSTEAFGQFMAASGASEEVYAALELLAPDDVKGVRRAGAEARGRLGGVEILAEIAEAVLAAWEEQGIEHAYAVRSSATAEELPTASFAGQQDTFLNVRGREALLARVRDCWVSLFTDRAILYRAQNGFSHREVSLSVVVQRMAFPEVSGILFTADPVSNHRGHLSIEASYGLGEALVAGLVTPDNYKVDKSDLSILNITVGEKQMAIRPLAEGGTVREEVGEELRAARALDDEQVRELAALGKRVEAHYGQPQDIEWAMEGGRFYVLQTRPITSLFPLPAPRIEDDTLRVYMSLSHAQVMTDPISPMGISIWRLLFPFGKPGPPTTYNPHISSAGGRIYIDMSPLLHLPTGRRFLPITLTMADPLSAGGLQEIIARDDFRRGAPKASASLRGVGHWMGPLFLKGMARLWLLPMRGSVEKITAFLDGYIQQMQEEMEGAAPGVERLKLGHEYMGNVFVDAALAVIPFMISGGIGMVLVNRLGRKYGDQEDVDALWRGLRGNVATEMDLEVGDLADQVRASPTLAEYLTTSDPGDVLDSLSDIPGGEEFLASLEDFMERYGMRGPAELDLARPRYKEYPAALLQAIIGNLQNQESGSHQAHHARLVAEAAAAQERLEKAVRRGPLGFVRAALIRRFIGRARILLTVREHPKYLLIRVVDMVKEAAREAAQTLQEAGRIDAVDDIFFLELAEAVAALEDPAEDLRPRIAQRKAEQTHFWRMTPPRVITSEGEIPVLKHSVENLPEGALPGVAVSAGVVEGVARVVVDPTAEVLNPGEILVAPYTDPGWTPLFINAAGLVTEVGGLMTHGSVVAREYGIPAVVGVIDATKQIRTGQRIRVEGSLGWVEILKAEG